MFRKPLIAACVLVLLAATAAYAGDVIDRIVAAVNGNIILQSDWDDALAYEALIGGKPLQQITAEDRQATLERLVDQELLREQIRPSDTQFQSDDETINARVQEIRKQYPDAATDQEWQNLLARYGLTEAELKSHIALQLEILHMVDERLTPTLQVDDKSIEDYYNQSFLPQLRQSGEKEEPLADVSPKIREILVQQKLNDALKEWLQTLHENSAIRMQATQPANGSQPR
jgi:peptidyl-prolyl cis-trans isomerase SurA